MPTQNFNENIQLLVSPPPAPAGLNRLDIQIMLPPPPIPAETFTMQTQVLVSMPWAVSMMDQETAVQRFTPDGQARPLRVIQIEKLILE